MHVSKAHNIALLFNYSVLSGIFREELQVKKTFRFHQETQPAMDPGFLECCDYGNRICCGNERAEK
jgi:hypothetical protein